MYQHCIWLHSSIYCLQSWWHWRGCFLFRKTTLKHFFIIYEFKYLILWLIEVASVQDIGWPSILAVLYLFELISHFWDWCFTMSPHLAHNNCTLWLPSSNWTKPNSVADDRFPSSPLVWCDRNCKPFMSLWTALGPFHSLPLFCDIELNQTPGYDYSSSFSSHTPWHASVWAQDLDGSTVA